jgi:hypothetical protein
VFWPAAASWGADGDADGETGVRWHPPYTQTEIPRIRTSLIGVIRLSSGVPL